MDEFIKTLEDAAEGIQGFLEKMLAATLDILETLRKWLIEVAKRIGNYLERLIPAAGKVLLALGKVALFYVPSILLFGLGFEGKTVWPFFIGAAWGVLITVVALTYRKKETTDTLEREDETENEA